MEILRTLTHSLAALRRTSRSKTSAVQQGIRVEEIQPVATEPLTDRRVKPDRRRRQEPFSGPDRRRKSGRRRPLLLHPRTRKATNLEDRRGRNLSTRA